MDIFENPFYVLGVSSRSNRRQILSAAEERAFLQQNQKAINEASNALIIPSKRLKAELRWFPGLNDEKVKELVRYLDSLNSGQASQRASISGLTGISLLNFAVYMFRFHHFEDVSAIVRTILLTDAFFESIDTEALCALINKDRESSGFPSVTRPELERELRNYCRDAVQLLEARLSSLSQRVYLELSGELATKYASRDDSRILSGLLDNCELRLISCIESERDAILGSLDFPDELSRHLRAWSELSRPLFLTSKARGLENKQLIEQGRRIIESVRQRSVELNNQRHDTKAALNLMKLLKEHMPDISVRHSELIEKDIETLSGLLKEQEEAERKREQERRDWAESIRYEATFGLIFRDKFEMSVNGISLNGRVTPLESITGVRWGGTRSHVNGISMGTDYVIAFRTPDYEVRLSPSEKHYDAITSRLWLATAGNIIRSTLESLKSGKTLTIGSIEFNHDGVFLSRLHWFTLDRAFFSWKEPLNIQSWNGTFSITSKDKKYSNSASYMNHFNTHILEFMIRNSIL